MTQLTSGSIAILGFNGVGADDFSFVLMADVAAGTVIYFTDVGVLGGTDSFGNNDATEGVVAWTASTAHTAGTVINYVADAAKEPAAREFSNPFQLSAGHFSNGVDFSDKDEGGDQLIAFQADLPLSSPFTFDNINFLFAIQSNSTGFQIDESGGDSGVTADPTDPNQSGLPTGLIEGETALALGSGPGEEDAVSNLVYIGPTSGTRAALLAAIADPANWDSPDVAPSQITADFTVSDAVANDDPVITVPDPAVDSTAEDTLLAVAGVSVADTEGDAVTVILNASGTLTVASSGVVTGNGSGTVSVTGTVAEVNTALAGLTFLPEEDFTGDTEITIQAFDDLLSFDLETITVTVTPEDDAPVVSGIDSMVSFTSADLLTEAQLVFPLAEVSDVDSTNLNSGQISVTYNSGSSASDQLSVLSSSDPNSGVEVIGGEIFFYFDFGIFGGGPNVQQVKIGTIVTDGSNGSNLVIDLGPGLGPETFPMSGMFYTTDVTPQVVQRILASIQYGNTAPVAGSRQLSVTVTDETAATSIAVTTDVEITIANAAPVLTDLVATIEIDPADVTNAQVVDSDVTLTDVDSTDLDGGQLRFDFGTLRDATGENLSLADIGGITVAGSAVSFSGDLIGTISADGQNGNSLVIDLSGTDATPAAVEALIEALRYDNSSGTPDPAREVSITVSDGDGGTSLAQTVSIQVVTPVVPDLTVTHTEGDTVTLIDDEAQVTVADPGAETFTTLTVSFTAGEVLAEDVLEVVEGPGVFFSAPYYSVTPDGGATAYFTVAGGSAGAPLVLTQFGTGATTDHMDLLVLAIGYSNSGGDDPTDGDRMVTFNIMQSTSGPFSSGPFTVNVDPVEDAPVLTDLETSIDLPFATVSTIPVVIDATVTVSDVDTAEFAGGRLTVENRAGGLAGDQLSLQVTGSVSGGPTVFTYGAATATVSGGSNGAPLVIDFSGTVDLAAVEAFIEAVHYATTDPEPPLSRMFSYTLEDGQGGTSAISQISVNITGAPTNQPPELSDIDSVVVLNRSDLLDAPQAVDTDVTVADGDSSDFNSGWLKISYDDPRVGSENQLSLVSPGGSLAIDGGIVYLGLDPIGTVVSDGSNGSAIEIAFTSVLATDDEVEFLIESLHYQNTSLTPDTEVVLLIEVNDGDGETSDAARVSITVNADGTSVDDSVNGTEDVPVVIAFADLLGNDTGFDDTVSVTSVSGAVNGTVTILGSNVVFTPTADYGGPASFTYTASDGTDSDSAEVAVTIAPVNDAPTLALTQTITDIDENSDTSARIKVADIVVRDDMLGINTLALTGADAASFEIIGSELFLKAGVSLDFESLDAFDVAVTVEDTSVGSDPDDSATVTLDVNDVNEAPTVALSQIITDIDENTDTSARIKVGDIIVTDDALGSETLGLTGADAASFEIIGTELFLKAGVSLDFESLASFDVAVTVEDASVGADPDDSATVSLDVNDVNEAPTVALNQTITDIDENTDTSARIKVADIIVTDDALGSETLGLTGADAASFEIIGSELFLKAGVSLDFESLDAFDVAVTVEDTSVGSDPDDSATVTLDVNDVNEAPTVALSQIITDIDENTDTSARIKVADIVVTDDALGSETLGLTGADAASFEIIGTELFLKAGVSLDFESLASFDVAVTVEDASVGADPDDSATVSLDVNDVNEAPTVALSQTITDIDENTDTSARIKVADIIVTDDALGSETLGLSGADAASFEIIGSELFLKAGVSLDFESLDAFDVAVTVEDTSVGSDPDDSATVTLDVNDVNEAPTVALSQIITDIDENTDTSARIKVADIVVTNDALGSETLGLSGADAASFEIIGSELFLKAGVSLDFESLDAFDVAVTVEDASVGSDPDDSAAVSLDVNDVNEAPTVTLSQTITDIDENSDTSARIKVADIVVTDDALGSETLGLTGADAASFEIDGSELFLKAGVSLDFESLASFDVAVTVEDASAGSDPDDSATVSLNVNDVNEAATGAPVISGTAAELQLLTVDTSSIADDDGIDAGTVALQWRRDGVAISGATASSYSVTTADVGAEISLSYSYTDDLGVTDTLTSAATIPVVATNQTLPGSSGADVLDGGAGDDSLSGGAGDDTLRGGAGDDTLEGGSGSNRLNGNSGDDVITSGADSSGDLIFGGSGNDTATGGPGDDTIYGQEGNDSLIGGLGRDLLVGQEGNDILTGGAQSDSLFGGDGNDYLNGGFASDLLNGGAGADRFYHAGIVGHGTDWVQDYSSDDGDVLIFGLAGATSDDFSLLAQHAIDAGGERAGDDAIQELFVIYNPTGQIIWALLDGADEDEILWRLEGSGVTLDLLA